MTNLGTFTIGTVNPIVVDADSLPAASVQAMIRRGLTHFFGNEIASKVSAAKSKHVEPVKAEDGTETVNEPLSDDEIAALRRSFVADFQAKLSAGTVGQSAPRAPSVDPLETEMNKIAKARAVAILKANNLKFPKDGETIKGAGGVELSGDDLISRQIAKDTDGITKEAKKVLADKAKRAKALAEQASGGVEAL